VYSRTGNSPEHDSLLLPNNKTVAETSDDEIRQIAARLGIENAWTAGRAQVVSQYHTLIKDVYDDAGMAAVKKYLEDKQKC